ncbi:MAG: helix-turn-helix transcriptional regulator [Desulfovibrionaceae bacterium]|nr:helix-turn-helix transcriptional regulator [Desulfovibrionaceae bacterium]
MYVLIPYDEYMTSRERPDHEVTLPHEVVMLAVVEQKGIVRAWREHLGLTQAEIARRMDVTQSAVDQLERPDRALRFSTRKRLAEAMGIAVEQLQSLNED